MARVINTESGETTFASREEALGFLKDLQDQKYGYFAISKRINHKNTCITVNRALTVKSCEVTYKKGHYFTKEEIDAAMFFVNCLECGSKAQNLVIESYSPGPGRD